MLIVLEGINKGGKTTLSKILSDHFNIPYFRNFRHPDMDSIKKYCNYNNFSEDVTQMNLIRTLKSSVILDRSLPSDYVYKKLLNDSFPKDVLNWWMCRLKEQDSIYLYIKISYDEYKNRNFNSSNANIEEMDQKTFNFATLLYDLIFDKFHSFGIKCIEFENCGDIDKKSSELIKKIEKIMVKDEK